MTYIYYHLTPSLIAILSKDTYITTHIYIYICILVYCLVVSLGNIKTIRHCDRVQRGEEKTELDKLDVLIMKYSPAEFYEDLEEPTLFYYADVAIYVTRQNKILSDSDSDSVNMR